MADSMSQRSSQECDWFPKDAKTARATSFFNMSVAHVVKGEIDVASKHFNSVFFCCC